MNQADASSSGLVCQVCGRRDETLRLVTYPYVVSFLIITYRRAFAGLWCARHRRLRLLLASFITSTIGWLGIPFGFVYTPLVLWQLARGGVQPAERNKLLLKAVADDALRQGDASQATRCLEAALELGDDDDARSRLSQLYLTHSAITEPESTFKSAMRTGTILLAAMVIGGLIGTLDYFVTEFLSATFRSMSSLYTDILSWAMLICLAFAGGLVIFDLMRWALARNRSTSPALAIVLAIVSAGIVLYGVLTGEGIGFYLHTNSQVNFHETGMDLISTVVSVLVRGGAYMAQLLPTATGVVGGLWVIVLVALGAYYLGGCLRTALRAVTWQQRIAEVRSNIVGAPSDQSLGAWLAIGVIACATVAVPLFLPQHETIDYFATLEHLREGNRHLDANELDQAAAELETALALKPNWAPVHSGLGWVYLYRNESKRAESEFTTALQIDPNWADAHHGLGAIYYARQNVGRAIDELQAAVRLAPDNAVAHQDLGMIYVERRDFDKGETELQTALQQNSKLANAHRYLSRVYFAQDKIDAGLKELDSAAALAPDDGVLQGEVGTIYFLMGDSRKAIPALQKAVTLLPEQADLHAMLGAALAGQNQFQEAQKHVDIALERAPEAFLTHYGAGLVAMRRGDMKQAEAHLRQAVQLDPGFLQSSFALARVYESEAKFDHALEQYQKMIATQPDWVMPYLARAMIYYQLDQLDLWQQELKRAQGVTKDEANTHYAWAVYYTLQRDLTKTEQELRQAEKLMPGNKDDVYQALAYLYTLQRKYDEAMKWIGQLDQDSVEAYSARSNIYIEQKLLDQALVEMKKAAALAPEDGSLNSGLSFIYFNQSKLPDALREAEQAVQKWPYYANGHINLAFARHARGELDQALAAAQRAIELEPKNGRGYYILGRIYLDQGQKDKAIEAFEKFLSLYLDRAYVRDWKVEAEKYLKQLKP